MGIMEMIKENSKPLKEREKKQKRNISNTSEHFFLMNIFHKKKRINSPFPFFFPQDTLPSIVIYSENPLRANSDQIKGYESPL